MIAYDRYMVNLVVVVIVKAGLWTLDSAVLDSLTGLMPSFTTIANLLLGPNIVRCITRTYNAFKYLIVGRKVPS